MLLSITPQYPMHSLCRPHAVTIPIDFPFGPLHSTPLHRSHLHGARYDAELDKNRAIRVVSLQALSDRCVLATGSSSAGFVAGDAGAGGDGTAAWAWGGVEVGL